MSFSLCYFDFYKNSFISTSKKCDSKFLQCIMKIRQTILDIETKIDFSSLKLRIRIMPLKNELDALLKEIAALEEEIDKRKPKRKPARFPTGDHPLGPLKKSELLTTEKQVYFNNNHYFKLTMISIEKTEVALEIWIKGILPLLLKKQNLEIEEWERICEIGDKDKELQTESESEWTNFFNDTIKSGKVDEEVLVLLNEGKKKVERMLKS